MQGIIISDFNYIELLRRYAEETRDARIEEELGNESCARSLYHRKDAYKDAIRLISCENVRAEILENNTRVVVIVGELNRYTFRLLQGDYRLTYCEEEY